MGKIYGVFFEKKIKTILSSQTVQKQEVAYSL